ncbi:hypothetical protein C0V97_15930 [Asaia sp. W19]|uniref:hypothetical protein n=1 Tax=unclassified Asaia TaxID=2685023 RepID=UPI000F8EF40C|nr:hypothetical protein [Asaia sp. W19]RUT24562.1 hypothetical protein C0V97_15930 [Asaia sp. W19]
MDSSSTLPLETSRDFVEPNYEALLTRIGRSMETPVLSQDPKLHLCTEDGRVIQPTRVGPAGYVSTIRASVGSVRLMSETGCRAAVIGPYAGTTASSSGPVPSAITGANENARSVTAPRRRMSV